MTRRWVGGLLIALALLGGGALMAAHLPAGGATRQIALRAPLRAQAAPAARPEAGAVDVNAADEAGLCGLKGVGPSLARAILTERQANGPFFYPEDLLSVPGIGWKKLAGFRGQLRFGVGETPAK